MHFDQKNTRSWLEIHAFVKSVLLVQICSCIATPMTMGHKVIKHHCLQISTPADLKTLQWVWTRNKVTANKAPLHTKNDQELKPFILKTLSGNIISRGCILHV